MVTHTLVCLLGHQSIHQSVGHWSSLSWRSWFLWGRQVCWEMLCSDLDPESNMVTAAAIFNFIFWQFLMNPSSTQHRCLSFECEEGWISSILIVISNPIIALHFYSKRSWWVVPTLCFLISFVSFQKFHTYMLGNNLIARLQAKFNSIQKALGEGQLSQIPRSVNQNEQFSLTGRLNYHT
jgi:hypothetical protein